MLRDRDERERERERERESINLGDISKLLNETYGGRYLLLNYIPAYYKRHGRRRFTVCCFYRHNINFPYVGHSTEFSYHMSCGMSSLQFICKMPVIIVQGNKI